MCILYFLVASSSTLISFQLSAVSRSRMFVGFLFCCCFHSLSVSQMAPTASSFSISSVFFDFFHTRIFNTFLRIASSHLYQLLLLLLLISTLLTVPFRLLCSVSAWHGTALPHLQLNVCVCCFLFDCILNEITPKKVSTVVQPN